MRSQLRTKSALAAWAFAFSFASVSHAALPPPWTATGSMATARYIHTATLLTNGKVLVAGGITTGYATATAELYDPAAGAWTTTGSLVAARYDHYATLLSNGKVLVAGGVGSDGTDLNSAEVYDPATGVWTATSSMASARYQHTATLPPNGMVYGVLSALVALGTMNGEVLSIWMGPKVATARLPAASVALAIAVNTPSAL